MKSSVRQFDRRTPPAEMYGHRRARCVGPGEYIVYGRDGVTRYEVTLGETDGTAICSCMAGQHGRPCYHVATALRRLRNALRMEVA